MNWSNDMIQRMNEEELAKDVTEAENLLQMHHERKVDNIEIFIQIEIELYLL